MRLQAVDTRDVVYFVTPRGTRRILADHPKIKRLVLEGECVMVELDTGSVYLLPLHAVTLLHVQDAAADQNSASPHQLPSPEKATVPAKPVARRRGRPPKRTK